RVRERLLRKQFQRRIVGHFAIFDQAAMAVIGIFAKADVRDDHQIEFGPPDRLDGALHDARRRISLRSALIFMFGNAKKDYAGDPEPFDFAAFLDQLVRRLQVDPRHGTDLHARAFARPNEHGINEAAGREAGLARHAAQGFGAAQASRSLRWKCHASLLLRGRCSRAGLISSGAKWRSNAETSEAAAASSASIATGKPALRIAFAVTGPTAAKA